MSNLPNQLFIDGRFVDAIAGDTYATKDPGNGGTIIDVARGTTADAELAIDAAARAFDNGEWSGAPPADRARVLMELADRIQAATARLAMTEAVDSGALMRRAGADMFSAARFIRAIARYAISHTPFQLPDGA